MKVDRVILGTWFQRTNLHLEEFFRFAKHGAAPEGLDPEQVREHRRRMDIKSAVFHEAVMNSVQMECGRISASMTEDGVILAWMTGGDIKHDGKELHEFHAHRLDPAIRYLFSLGAPLPKEVSRIREEYLLVAFTTFGPKDVASAFQAFDDDVHSHAVSEGIEVWVGRELALISIEGAPFGQAELDGFVRDLVFFREFERQLHSYLRLHREIWDEITGIREARTMRYRDFPAVRGKIMSFQKTLGIVKARLNQMEDILGGRRVGEGKIMAKVLSGLGMYNFNSLLSSQKYVSHLWEMTADHADDTLELLDTLYQENTQRELNALKFITLITAITSFFGMNIAFPWDESWPRLQGSSFAVAALVTAVAFAVYHLLRVIIQNRYFVLKEKVSGKKSPSE
jgi:hypothetical protein